MKRPPITPGPFALKAGRNIETPSGTFYLTYGRDKDNSAPFFSSPTELDAIAKATAALPALLEALEKTTEALEDAREIILDLDPDAHARTRPLSDRISKTRSALRLAGYEF
jgi:hypothetical protein